MPWWLEELLPASNSSTFWWANPDPKPCMSPRDRWWASAHNTCIRSSTESLQGHAGILLFFHAHSSITLPTAPILTFIWENISFRKAADVFILLANKNNLVKKNKMFACMSFLQIYIFDYSHVAALQTLFSRKKKILWSWQIFAWNVKDWFSTSALAFFSVVDITLELQHTYIWRSKHL